MATTSKPTSVEKPDDNVQAPSETAHNVLTADMPQPPGVLERKGRRKTKGSRRKGPFVKYVGSSSRRVIAYGDWRSLGIPIKGESEENKPGHEWDIKNDFLIECDKFSDEQLDYLLVDDMQPGGGHSFLEMDYDTDGNLVQVAEYSE
jgi:hypothetical protein